jgi:hypothetical protein
VSELKNLDFDIAPGKLLLSLLEILPIIGRDIKIKA